MTKTNRIKYSRKEGLLGLRAVEEKAITCWLLIKEEIISSLLWTGKAGTEGPESSRYINELTAELITGTQYTHVPDSAGHGGVVCSAQVNKDK